AVDRDHYLLPSLGLDLGHDGAVAARGGGPADAPHVISTHVIAQARKRGRRARWPRAPLAHERPEPSAQRQLDALDRHDVGKDGNAVRQVQPHLPAPPAVTPPYLQVDLPEVIGAASRR